MSPRVLLAVTHLSGTGHLVRTLALARAIRAAGGAPLVLSGGRPPAHLDPAGVACVQLPPLAVAGLDFGRLLDGEGRQAGADLLAARRRLALETLARFDPEVLVTETWPLGRGALRDEFGTLARAHLARPGRRRLLASVRDIPEPPSRPEKLARAAADLAGFEAILVHGDPALARLEEAWPLPRAAPPAHHTGFVAEPMPPPLLSPEVLVAVGGGDIGRPLLRLAAAAAALSPRPWRLLAGGPDAAAFAAGLPGPARAEPARADYRARLAGAACSVSLAGYNTVADLLGCRTPAILVPMDEGGQREQGLRARALARAGTGLAVLDPAGLAPAALAAAVEAAIARGPRSPTGIALDGAARAARLILDGAAR